MVRQEGTTRLFCNKFLLGQKQMKNISPNFMNDVLQKQNDVLEQDNSLVEFPFLMAIIFQRI